MGAATPDPGPLYVYQLEQTIRDLDRLVSSDGPRIRSEHPEDHGLEPWVAELVEKLRLEDE